MKIIRLSAIFVLTICIMMMTSCHNDTSQTVDTKNSLKHAQPYFVVDEQTWMTEKTERSVAYWCIISKDASGYEEFAQTAAQAALDLYERYKSDYSLVTLLPLAGSYIHYAKASFAADGRGSTGFIESEQDVDKYWKIDASDRELTNKELAIIELWSAKARDFPVGIPPRSLPYDETALRQYISNTLKIPWEEVQIPILQMTEYKLDQSFIDWTISLAEQRSPEPSFTPVLENKIKVEPSPDSYISSKEKPSKVLLCDVQVRVDACDQDYFSPWFPSLVKGGPCLIVSGHIQNLDKENLYIYLKAEGYNEFGDQVAGIVDRDLILGAILLHLQYEESVEFILHLNLSQDISNVKVFADSYQLPIP